MRTHSPAWIPAAALLLCGFGACAAAGSADAASSPGMLGLFEGQSDIGSVAPPGSASYDPATHNYTITSAGANTWYHVDDFHFLWKKASGDMALTAEVSFPPITYNHEPNPHRKALLMFRQTLDAGGIYVDAAPHGSGLVALQYRRERGANSQDIELNIDAPRTLRLEKRGDVFTLFLSMTGEPIHQVGASITLHLKEPFYVGIGAVSHDVGTTDAFVFLHVTLQPLASMPKGAPSNLYSTLQTIQIEDQFRRAMMIRTVPASIQSANWAPDGKSIYAYEDGHVVKIPYLDPAAGGTPEIVDTGPLVDCGGNYGISPDGHTLAMTCAEAKGGLHQVYVMPARGGGTSVKLTQGPIPSYFHAWSPDNKTIAFTRGSAGKADLFTVAVTGGAETRLTHDTVNDGPDYSPDGKYIYFDSSRSGSMQIWRMLPDGAGAEQLTDDANVNTSPHVSRDGRTIAFLSQPPGSGADIGPAAVKVMAAGDGLIRTVVDFLGYRNSFSTYGWGDANHLAFVSYQRLPAGDHDADHQGK
jgi:TolB protein